MENLSSTSTAPEEEKELPAVVEEKYKKYLLERKPDIVRRMSNIDKMAQELLKRKILIERETMKIFQRPLLHQKAEALMDALIKTASFKNVILMVEILSLCHNHMASEYFLAIHSNISTTEKFDHGLIYGCKEYEERHKNDLESGTSESDDSSDIASLEDLHNEPDGVVLEMDELVMPERKEDHEPEKNRGARAIIDDAYIYQFEAALKEIQSLSDLIDCPTPGCETSLHYALYNFDDADCHKAAKMILDRFEELVDIDDTSDKISLADFINMKCELTGYTALHMAILYRDVPSVQLLYRNYGADMFIKDTAGQTPLEMMYLYLPQEVNFILDSSVTACAKSYKTGKMVIGADFRSANIHLLATQISSYVFLQRNSGVLGNGMIHSPGSEDWDEKRDKKDYSKNDLSFLANVVNASSKRQKLFLPHPLISLFLLIQWRRYKEWILASAIMQIFLKILYAALVVHVFLHTCRYNPSPTNSPQGNVTTNTSSGDFVVGRMYYTCEVDLLWKVVAGILAFFGGFLIFHEFVELHYKISAVLKPSTDGSIIHKMFSGLKNYIYDLENVLQLLCATFIVYICMEMFRGILAPCDYAIASGSIVLGSILILVELGNFPWFSVYIQILIKVTKSFTKFLTLYGVLIIAFSISFSIAFPSEAEFMNLLQAIPRMIIMMSGEIEYKDLVYSEEPKMVATGQIVFVCFVIIMSFILTNLLIGLVVSDVKELTEKAQVVAMSVTLERCNTMANTLRLRYWRWMLLPLKKLIEFSYWIIRKLETRSGGEMANLDDERYTFELEPWHTMKLGPNSRIAMLQLPEKLQKNIEKLLKRQLGTTHEGEK